MPTACCRASRPLDWPDSTKRMQAAWIGRSEGAEITFGLEKPGPGGLRVFTTRPDTLFGCTYMVLAPEHALVDALTTPEHAGGRRGLPQEGRLQERPRAHRPGEGQDRRLHRLVRRQSRQRRTPSDLGRRLRAHGLRDRAPSWPCPPTTSATSSSRALQPARRARDRAGRPFLERAGAEAPLHGRRQPGPLRRLHRPRLARGQAADHGPTWPRRAPRGTPSTTSCATGSSPGSATGASRSPSSG
jgi:hypothetical protein